MQFAEFRTETTRVSPNEDCQFRGFHSWRGGDRGDFCDRRPKISTPLLPSPAKLIERLKEKLRQTGEGGRRATFVTGSRRVLRMLLYVTGNKSSPAAYTDQRRRPKEFSKLSKARRKETLLNIVYMYIHEACIGTHLILTRIREVEPIIQLVSLGNLPRVRVSRKLWKKGRGLMFRWKN